MFRKSSTIQSTGRKQKSKTHRRHETRLQMESLETRDMMSWSSIPNTLTVKSFVDVSFVSNARSGADTVRNNEIDVMNFTAPRSGTYTIEAGKNGSRIDTMAGVFNQSGQLLAGNDDAAGNTTDSRFTVYLQGGTRYALAVTNYTGTSNGGYKWSITGPPLSVFHENNIGNGIKSWGSAALHGNSLDVTLVSSNFSNWSTHNHRIDVYLLNSNNQPIHRGSWSLTARTGGSIIAGLPSSNTRTHTFDVSGFDLKSLRNIRIVVS